MGKVLPGGGVMVGYELRSWYTGTSFQGAELAYYKFVVVSFDNDSLMLVFRAYFDRHVFLGCEK